MWGPHLGVSALVRDIRACSVCHLRAQQEGSPSANQEESPHQQLVLLDLDLGILASRTEKIIFCCLSHLVYCILL